MFILSICMLYGVMYIIMYFHSVVVLIHCVTIITMVLSTPMLVLVSVAVWTV